MGMKDGEDCKCKFPNGDSFSGVYKDDSIHSGSLYLKSGVVFEGKFRSGKPYG